MAVRTESEATQGAVLVVDDDKTNTDLLQSVLTRARYDVRVASSGEAALEAVSAAPPDVMVLDVMMPGLSGFEVCRQVKSDPETRLIPIVLLTALTDRRDRLEGITTGADHYLTKPVDIQELKVRLRSLIALKRFTDGLDSAEALFVNLALTIEARDPHTEDHCQRLAHYASMLGEDLGLDSEDQRVLHLGGFLHDLGKIGIPDAVLLKSGRLTETERRVIERHPVIGDSLCAELRALDRIRPIVRHHHERLDGSGYPDNLAGDEIPLLAQVVSVVDIFDALTSTRAYRTAAPREVAWQVLRDEAGKGWRSAEIVEAFIELDRRGDLTTRDTGVSSLPRRRRLAVSGSSRRRDAGIDL